MVDVIIRSWLSYDGYECCGKTFKLDKIKELKELVAGREINWIKGQNTFAGKPVSDRFAKDMKELYYAN